MSTHFRPRSCQPPTPSSPVRPSTAHSTIRPVTPSPPNTLNPNTTFKPTLPLPRPKSEHALGSPELATYTRYFLKAKNENLDDSQRGGGLRRGGAVSGRSSPVKSCSKSPRKRPFSTPPGLSAYVERSAESRVKFEETQEERQEIEELVEAEERVVEEEEEEEEEENDECPDTPTPMTREQKRQAYVPLGAPLRLGPAPSTLTPDPALSRKPIPLSLSTNRISVSGQSKLSGISVASKHSIFSTPGRDELERKKALVEEDEGPFARVQSMMDLDAERRRISSGGAIRMGKERKWWGCRCGCVVM